MHPFIVNEAKSLRTVQFLRVITFRLTSPWLTPLSDEKATKVNFYCWLSQNHAHVPASDLCGFHSFKSWDVHGIFQEHWVKANRPSGQLSLALEGVFSVDVNKIKCLKVLNVMDMFPSNLLRKINLCEDVLWPWENTIYRQKHIT